VSIKKLDSYPFQTKIKAQSLEHLENTMVHKERNPIDWSVKQAKYKDLKANNKDKFMKKIAKLSARKELWYGILRAVQRFENFHDNEDEIPQIVQREFAHHISKLQVMDQIHKEA